MKVITFGILILLFMTTAGYCQKQTPFFLQLTIKSDKQVYTVGEEIILVAELKNVTDNLINVFVPLSSPGQIEAGIFIQGPQGEYKYRGPLKEYSLGKSNFRELAPGQSVSDDFPIKKPYFNLVDPGEYIIQYKYFAENGKYLGIQSWQGALISNAITIEVMDKKISRK